MTFCGKNIEKMWKQSLNISQKTLELSLKWVNWAQQGQGFEVAIPKPWSQSHRKFVGRAEKVYVSKATGMSKNFSKMLWKDTHNTPPPPQVI